MKKPVWVVSAALVSLCPYLPAAGNKAVPAPAGPAAEAAKMPESGVCAHRGDQSAYPENTVPAIESACRKGVAMVEFDVARCRTGELVVMHDSTVDRTTTGRGRVAELDFAYLRSLDAGVKKGLSFTGTKIPTFDEAIDCLPPDGIWINVHCKSDVAVEVAEKIREKGRLHQAFVTTSLAAVAAAQKKVPGLIGNNGNRTGSWTNAWTRAECRRYAEETAASTCTFLQMIPASFENWTAEDSEIVHKAGGKVIFFFTNRPADLPRILAKGIDFILTDDCDALQRAWRGHVQEPNDEWRSVPVDRVKLSGALGYRIDLTITNNLMQLDLEETFFRPFREKKAKGGFIGLGKLLDSAVYLAKYCGDPAVIARKDEIARVLAETQAADGYIGYFAPEARMHALWDLHETGFILQGLVSDWELFRSARSLTAARKAADYVMTRWAGMRDGWEFHNITDRETTLGLAHGFIRLARITGEEKYRAFAVNERALKEWDAPIVLGREGMLYGQAYGYLGTALEQLELYGRDADPKLLRASFRGLDHMTRRDGLLINGTGGIAECWTDDQDGEGCAGETCMITFQFLFYDRMIRLGVGDTAKLGDLMERLACNALPAAQSRDGRHLRYYTPLNGDRKYFQTDAYCCPNNFRRAMGRLPGYVYYEKDGAILANLFTASKACLDAGTVSLSLTCDTDYPSSGIIRYTLEPDHPAQFAFKVRIPGWCQAPAVTVNGKRVTYPFSAGEILSLPRVWKKGDVVELDLPMPVRCVKGRKRQSGRFAVMRGPQLYALDTRKVAGFEKSHPLDAASVIMLDPALIRLAAKPDASARPGGTAIETRCNVRDFDRGIGPGDPAITLTEFADPDGTLTYFRTPVPQSPLIVDDELFVEKKDPERGSQRGFWGVSR